MILLCKNCVKSALSHDYLTSEGNKYFVFSTLCTVNLFPHEITKLQEKIILFWQKIREKNVFKKEETKYVNDFTRYLSGRGGAPSQKLGEQGEQDAPKIRNSWVLLHFYVTISEGWGSNCTPCTPGCAATAFWWQMSRMNDLRFSVKTRVAHSVEITGILSHAFLAKISWK